MITESKRPRTPARRLCSDAASGTSSVSVMTANSFVCHLHYVVGGRRNVTRSDVNAGPENLVAFQKRTGDGRARAPRLNSSSSLSHVRRSTNREIQDPCHSFNDSTKTPSLPSLPRNSNLVGSTFTRKF